MQGWLAGALLLGFPTLPPSALRSCGLPRSSKAAFTPPNLESCTSPAQKPRRPLRGADGSQSTGKAFCGSLPRIAFYPSGPRVRQGPQEIRLPWPFIDTWILESSTGLLGLLSGEQEVRGSPPPSGQGGLSTCSCLCTLGTWLSGASEARAGIQPGQGP